MLASLMLFSVSAFAAKPVARFTISPTAGTAPLDISLDASASSDLDGTAITQYSWAISGPDFARNEQLSDPVIPSVVLPNAGTYTVTLVVRSGGEVSDVASRDVVVDAAPTNKKPTATFTATPTEGEAPLAVSFTSTITDGDGVSTISWDFGDGEVSALENPTHTYTQAGTYEAKLTVTDSGDTAPNIDTVVVTHTITVQAPTPAPAPDFKAEAEPGNPQTVHFTYTGTGGKAPLKYTWLFGDGGGSADKNPTHTYVTAGDYVVTIEVIDGNQNQAKLSRNITVLPNNQPPVSHDDFVNVISGEEIIIDVTRNDEDENKAGLQIQYLGDPPHGSTEVVDGNKIKYVSDQGYVGQDNFDYTVRDEFGVVSNGSTVTIQVARGNLPPTVTIQGNPYSNGGGIVTLEGSATDPEGDTPIAYQWTQVSGKPVEISNADQPTATFRAPLVIEDTVLKFRLTATDALGAASFAEVAVRIGTVDPPVAKIDTPDKTVLEGETVKLTGRGIFLGEELTADRRTLFWTQIAGPEVPISDPTRAEITFVAPTVDNTAGDTPEVELQFQLKVTMLPDKIDAKSEPVTVTVADNGITGIDPQFIPTQSKAQTAFGVKALEGGLVELEPLPDSVITNNTNRPRRTPIGILDIGVKPSGDGFGVFQIQLLEPLPEDYAMFSYSDESGWTRLTEEGGDVDSLSADAYLLNPARDRVTVKLRDVAQAPRAAGDIDAQPGMIRFRGGPGQITYPVSGSASVSGGAMGFLEFFLLGFGLLRGRSGKRPKLMSCCRDKD